MDSQNNTQPTQEEILKNWEENWKEEEKKFDSPFSRKEFTFNKSELKQLLQQGTMEAMGQKIVEFARSATNDIINVHVLPRVGITPNPSMRILYDFNSGRFMVWVPKESKPTEVAASSPTLSEQSE